KGAAQLVSGDIDDLPLTLRDETLADVVRAAARPESVGALEIARIKQELRLAGELRAWLTAVAPAAMRAVGALDAEGREEGEAGAWDVEDARDAEAEREAEAIDEATAQGVRARLEGAK